MRQIKKIKEVMLLIFVLYFWQRQHDIDTFVVVVVFVWQYHHKTIRVQLCVLWIHRYQHKNRYWQYIHDMLH